MYKIIVVLEYGVHHETWQMEFFLTTLTENSLKSFEYFSSATKIWHFLQILWGKPYSNTTFC